MPISEAARLIPLMPAVPNFRTNNEGSAHYGNSGNNIWPCDIDRFLRRAVHSKCSSAPTNETYCFWHLPSEFLATDPSNRASPWDHRGPKRKKRRHAIFCTFSGETFGVARLSAIPRGRPCQRHGARIAPLVSGAGEGEALAAGGGRRLEAKLNS